MKHVIKVLVLIAFFLIVTSCEDDETVFTVTFDSMGGSDVAAIEISSGHSFDLPTPTKEGHTFDGWYVSQDQGLSLDHLWSHDTDTVIDEITLYAKWTINQYTITFDSNGGSEIVSITQDYGTPITLLDDPIRDGYIFMGWDPLLPETMPPTDMTVKAIWQYMTLAEIYDRIVLAETYQDYDIFYTDDAALSSYELDRTVTTGIIESDLFGILALEFDSLDSLETYVDQNYPFDVTENLVYERDEDYPLILFIGSKELLLNDIVSTEDFITSTDGKEIYWIFPDEDELIINIPEGTKMLKLIGLINTSRLEMRLPSTLADIRSLGSIEYLQIDVHDDNQTYADYDGSLYNKDLTRLIRHKSFENPTEIVLSETLTVIDPYAFIPGQLSRVTIPESVMEIGEGAFLLNPLIEIIIEGDETRFNDDWELIGFPLRLKSTVIKEQGLYFDTETARIVDYDEAFGGTVAIPSRIQGIDVTSISKRAFEMKSLTHITIPETITAIGASAFAYNRFTEIIIEGDEMRFNDDWELIGFWILMKPTVVEYQGFHFDTETGTILFYDSDYGKDVIIPSSIEGFSVTHIGNEAFKQDDLSSIIIPASVTSIGDHAFAWNLLTDIIIPDSVTTIGLFAFYHNNLSEVIIPDQVTFIDHHAFAFNQITHLVLPESLGFIGEEAFAYNPLATIVIAGDETRFNEDWDVIGFPISLKPLEE